MSQTFKLVPPNTIFNGQTHSTPLLWPLLCSAEVPGGVGGGGGGGGEVRTSIRELKYNNLNHFKFNSSFIENQNGYLRIIL